MDMQPHATPATTRRRHSKAQRGVIMFLFAGILIFVLVPAIGLALDLGVAYSLKARLQSASDGAALAATRSLGRGMTQSQRETIAGQTAQRFFDANMHTGWAGLSNPTATVTFPNGPARTVTIRVDTSVQMSTYFMRVLGKPTLTLKSRSQTTRRDVNIMLVLDRSGSLANSGSCEPMKQAAKSFINTFQDGRDKVGLVTYGVSYNVDALLRDDFRTGGTDIVTHLNNINCTGWTNSAAAYSLAYDQIAAADEAGALNVILFFTDGAPNTITMPRMLVSPTSTCDVMGNKFGVITPSGGIYEAEAAGPPPITSDGVLVGSGTGCSFALNAGNFSSFAGEFVGLTRSEGDGDAGNDLGEDGKTDLGDSPGRGNKNKSGSGHRWDKWDGDLDAFGNSLFGYKDVTTDGDGRIQITSGNIHNAGINALANAATRSRAESKGKSLDVVTYVIGLGVGGGGPEVDLLHRVANTPESPTYDSSKPKGLMIYATEPGQLEAAFSLIASELMRIAM